METLTEEVLINEVEKILDIDYGKASWKRKIKTTKKLVLSGGGIRGFAQLGALHVLDELGILQNIEDYVGTSVGGMIIILLVIGYKPIDIYRALINEKFADVIECDIDRMINNFGLDDGSGVMKILSVFLAKKGVTTSTTFLDLYNRTNKNINMIGCCLTKKNKKEVLSHRTTPNMPIIMGIRITSSIPFIFEPVRYEGHVYVDGGCIDNYPCNVVENSDEDTIGVFIKNNLMNANSVESIENYAYLILQSFIDTMAEKATGCGKDYTLIINYDDYGAADFSMPLSAKKKMFEHGYKKMANKFY